MSVKRYYFLGIGGIGMSALARFLHRRGHTVAGYDRTDTPLTQELANQGIAVGFTVGTLNPAEWDEVVYTPAVGEQNADLLAARAAGLPTIKRAAFLGKIAQQYSTLAVAGTHGKTTTSSMLATFLKLAGNDCSALVGGITANFGTNYIEGNSETLVVEADEFDRSFLHLHPQHAILTSADPDHLDIYGTAEAVVAAYQQFAQQVKGTLFAHENLRPVLAPLGLEKVAFYGGETSEIRAINIHSTGPQMTFDYVSSSVCIPGVVLNVPGHHNLTNALAAMALALHIGTDYEALKHAVGLYQGVKRRFEILLHTPNITYIDDYAHHPAELEATLTATRQLFPTKRLIAVFQPHLFTRTRDFADGFARALDLADEVFLLHIYPARELSIPNVSSEMVFQQITNTRKHLLTLNEFPDALTGVIREPTVLLTLGAGDIDTKVGPMKRLLENLEF